MIKALKVIFLMSCLSYHGFIYSQHEGNKLSLKEVLNELEKTFQVSFSYADDTINDKYVDFSLELDNLQEILNQISNQTQVSFEVLNDTFIVIKPIENSLMVTQNLNEVLLTNYLTQGITLNKNGSLTIEPKDFGILPGLIEPDVLQTVQALPSIISIDETVSNVNVRGGTHDQNLILWEGIKMYQSGHFFGMISAFNPYLTETIDIYKNGSSSKYGDGVSSVMDMRLSDQIENQNEVSLGLNMIHADGFAKIPLGKKTQLFVSSRRSLTDFLNTPTYQQYYNRVFEDSDLNSEESQSQNERFYFYDSSLKVLHKISDKDLLQVYGITMKNYLDYQEQSKNDRSYAESNSKLSQQTISGGINYTRHWNEKLVTETEFYVTKYDLNAKNQDISNNQQLIQENQVNESAIKLHAIFQKNSRLNLSGGYQFFETGISNLEDVNRPDFRKYIKEVIRSHSVFTDVMIQSKSKRTYFKPGLRVNYFDKFNKFLLEPRLSFGQKLANHFRLEILGEFKSQTSSQIIDLQQDFLGVEKRRWVLSNESDIPIIQSKQLSAGLHYNKNKLLISLEGFIKKVDGITTKSQGFQNQYQFVNATGTYETRGFDFLLNKHFNQFSSWLSYTYSTNNYQYNELNNGSNFPNNVDVRHQLSLATTYDINNFEIALGFNWHTGKPFTNMIDTNSDNLEFKAPNSDRLNDYLRMDVSATYKLKLFNDKNAIAGFSIWNVTDRKNILNYYFVEDSYGEIKRVENHSLGFTPNVSFRVNL